MKRLSPLLSKGKSMRRSQALLAAVFSLLRILLLQTAATGADYSLDIKLHIFEQPTWTWAASTQSVVEYYGKDMAQCTIASLGYNSDCCADPSSCNRGEEGESIWGILFGNQVNSSDHS